MKRLIFISIISFCSLLFSFWLPGCDDLITEVITDTVFGHPSANFISDIDSGCAPLTVTFTDDSEGPRDRWVWDFGDGDSSTDTNPIHIYDSAGTYTVTLRIFADDLKGEDFELKKRFIVVGQSIADFTVDRDSGCTGTEVTFTPVQYGGITSWRWDFGDGSPFGTDSIVTHIYDSVGVFDVTLTVNGDCGQTVLHDSGLIQITECPSVYFFTNDTAGCVPYTVTLFDTSFAGTTHAITDRLWDFGNGTTDNSQNPTVLYDTAGVYTVKLTITSTGGQSTDSIVDYIVVNDLPTASFIAESFRTGCFSTLQDFVVKFKDQSTGNITSREWDFGDGKISNDTNPAHTFDNPGQYTIRLIVDGACGVDTLIESDYITLYDSLLAFNYTLSKDTISIATDPDSLVLFQDFTSDLIVGRQWDFGDGSTSSADSVNHRFDVVGTYEIRLTRWNDCDSLWILDTVEVVP